MTIPTTLRLAAIALVLTMISPTLFAAQDEPETISKFYQVHYLRPGVVEVLGKQACGGEFTHTCKSKIRSI